MGISSQPTITRWDHLLPFCFVLPCPALLHRAWAPPWCPPTWTRRPERCWSECRGRPTSSPPQTHPTGHLPPDRLVGSRSKSTEVLPRARDTTCLLPGATTTPSQRILEATTTEPAEIQTSLFSSAPYQLDSTSNMFEICLQLSKQWCWVKDHCASRAKHPGSTITTLACGFNCNNA